MDGNRGLCGGYGREFLEGHDRDGVTGCPPAVCAAGIEQSISQKSCKVLAELGTDITWIESYVTGDKIYCVYIAPNKELIQQHADKGGFPANRISGVRAVIDLTTAE